MKRGSWERFFRKRKEHYFLSTLKSYKRKTYRKIFDKIFDKSPKNKIIWITDSFDQFYGLDTFHKFRQNNIVIDSDISLLCIKKVRKQYKLALDIKKVPFKSNSIDIVISPSTVDHFDKIFFSEFLNEIERILKPRGIAIILLHNKQNIFMRFLILRILEREKYYTYSKSEVLKTLEAYNNLKLKCILYTFNLPFPLFSTSFINFLDRHKIKINFIRKIIYKFLDKASEISEYPYFSELICFVIKKI